MASAPFMWYLFDKVRALTRSGNLFRHENILQDQSSLKRIVNTNEFINFSQQASLIDQTNLQINRLERYKDFDQMDETGEIFQALDMYADESSLIDPEKKHSVMVKSSSITVKETIEDFLYNTLMVDHWLRPWMRSLCKYGDLALEIIPTRDRTGVASLRDMTIYNFTRVQTKYGDLIGFFHQDALSPSPEFFHPWQVMHCRLISLENIYKPYGKSILEGARKHYKQLRLMEDAALIYRITRAPEKRVFTIPVGNMPTHEISGYMVDIARTMKKKAFLDPATGDVNERWHPLIQEDDFFLPKRSDGEQPTIDTLPGAENLDQIADIEYFKKKMVSALKIPMSRVGIGDASDSDSKPLSQTAPEFAKAIQHIQREMALSLKKVVIVHMALMGFSIDQLKDFELYMAASSSVDALYRIEAWQTRADIMDKLKSTEMFSDAWIMENFTDLTADEIDEMEEDRRLQAELQQLMGGGEPGMGGGMGGMGGGGGMGMGDLGGMGGMGGPPGGGIGGPPPGGGAGGPPPPGAMPESALTEIEQSLIQEDVNYLNREMINMDRREAKLLIEEKIYEYKHRRHNRKKRINEDIVKGASKFQYLMEHNELDGLEYKREGKTLMIESPVDKGDVDEIKKDTIRLLSEDSQAVITTDSINESDLPR